MGGKACVTVKKVGAAAPYPPTKNRPLTVGRVSVSAPAGTFLYPCSQKKAWVREACKAGVHVPFAIMSALFERFPHANVQRGLAAAPFAIPAPGGKSALTGRFFFSRSKTTAISAAGFVGRVSISAPAIT